MTSQQFAKLLDHELHFELIQLVAEERRISVHVLKKMAQVEEAGLALRMGYPNFFQYCVRELKYSEYGAWTRVAASRLLARFPNYERSLETGEVSVTTFSEVQGFLENERRNGNAYDDEKALELLDTLRGLSSREAQIRLAEVSPNFIPNDRTKPISNSRFEIRFVADGDLISKLDHLRDLLAHQLRADSTYNSLLHLIVDIALQKVDPMVRKPRLTRADIDEDARHIPSQLRREVLTRDAGRCTDTSRQTGRRCGSPRAIQIDQVIPRSAGGKTELSNLRLLCAPHNRLAYQEFTSKQQVGDSAPEPAPAA